MEMRVAPYQKSRGPFGEITQSAARLQEAGREAPAGFGWPAGWLHQPFPGSLPQTA